MRKTLGRSFAPSTDTSKRSPGPTTVLWLGAGKLGGPGCDRLHPTRTRTARTNVDKHRNTKAIFFSGTSYPAPRTYAAQAAPFLQEPANAQVRLEALPLH